MKEPKPTTRESYFAHADSWAKDRLAELHASRRTAWIIASIAIGVTICETLALTALIPLKRIEPYTLLVDRQTGYVQLLKPLEPQLVASQAALTNSFLVQYVIAREGFDIDTVQTDYRKVAGWSQGSARSDYLAQMPATNPNSPLASYPRSTVIDIAVKSVTALGDRAALVRFDSIRRDVGQQPGPGRPWIAVVRYDYVNKPMSVGDRFINPLGFQVLRYRRSAEAPVPAPISSRAETKLPSTTLSPATFFQPGSPPDEPAARTGAFQATVTIKPSSKSYGKNSQ